MTDIALAETQARRDLAPLARPFRKIRSGPHAYRSGAAVPVEKNYPEVVERQEDEDVHGLDRPDLSRVARGAARGERAGGPHLGESCP